MKKSLSIPILLLFLPLLISLGWGTAYTDTVYDTLRYARNLAAGRGLLFDAQISGYAPPLSAPLFVWLLALTERVGLPLIETSFVLSVLGWGVTAVLITRLGRDLKRPFAGVLTALLLSFNPIIITTLGTEMSWVMALACAGVILSSREQWWRRTAVLSVLLLLHFDISTLALVLIFLGWQWQRQQRFLWPSGLILVAVAAAWGGYGWVATIPLSWPALDPAAGREWVATGQQLLAESEFYWLFLPLAAMGLLVERGRRLLWGGIGWLGISAVGGSALAGVGTAVLVLALVGLGVDWLGRYLESYQNLRITYSQARLALAGLAILLVGSAQASSLWHRFQVHSATQIAIERQLGLWIQSQSTAETTIFTSRRIAFWADRPLAPGSRYDIDPLQVGDVLASLAGRSPGIVVTFRSLGWDFLTGANWFQERYTSARTVSSPTLALTPYQAWVYRPGPFDRGETKPLVVDTENGLKLINARYWPERMQPGDAIHVTLFWQATQTVPAAFRTIVRVISPADGVAWAQRDEQTPRSIPVSWWQPGRLIEERFVLTTTHQIPVGAYQINVSLRPQNEADFWAMYQNQDVNPLDRVLLGYTAVPWPGPLDATTTSPVGATFGDQISLMAFDVSGEPVAGETIAVDLYWQALRRPDADYIVFVHLLNEDNEWVAGDDRGPVDGRFPTIAWLPEEVVKDVHPITIPADLPAGTYQLKVGLYVQGGERLRVWDQAGVEQTDRAFALPEVIHIP